MNKSDKQKVIKQFNKLKGTYTEEMLDMLAFQIDTYLQDQALSKEISSSSNTSDSYEL